MHTTIRILSLTATVLALSGCANAINTQQVNKELAGPEWVGQSFRDIDGTTTAPGTVPLIVQFIPPDTLAARADNEIWGRYATQDGALSISKLGRTKRGLSPGSREEDFIQALENATAYSIDGNKLCIYYFDKTSAINLITDR